MNENRIEKESGLSDIEDPYRETRIGWLEYRKDKCEHCAKALGLVQRGKLIKAGREMLESDEIDCLRLTDRVLWGWIYDLDDEIENDILEGGNDAASAGY